MSAHLSVHVRAGARRAGLKGLRPDGSLVLAVAAPPEGGRANEAVAELLGETLGVRARDIEIVRGLKSRTKLIEVRGLEERELRQRLESALSEAGEA
ncbi:MAG TPA: DUF167 domain-containing protein [Candidatus Eisenbacteria bacterium]